LIHTKKTSKSRANPTKNDKRVNTIRNSKQLEARETKHSRKIMEINRARRGRQAKYNGNKVEIDYASLREIRLTSTKVYYFTELARLISIVFPLYFSL
jgi:hypothetical protein